MIKKVSVLLTFILILIFAVGCDLLPSTTDTSYNISFETNEGTPIDNYIGDSGTFSIDYIKQLSTTKNGYVFDGWYLDQFLSSKYDFTTALTGLQLFMLNGI